MSFYNVMDIAGSGMTAQMIRLNTIASNLSNQNSMVDDKDKAYRAKQPVFSAVYDEAKGSSGVAGVKVDSILESKAPLRKEHMPGHALADEQGYVYFPNVNPIEEMANMVSASRSYQDNIQVVQTAKSLIMRTISSINEQ